MHFLLTLAVLISCYEFKKRNRILRGNQISNKILTLPLVYDNKSAFGFGRLKSAVTGSAQVQ